MRTSVKACRGLRLLRQDPWECLASFILSSTKQIVQIRQIVALLCERFGESVSLAPPKRGVATAAMAGEGILISKTSASSPRPSPPLGEEREKNPLHFSFPTPQRLAACTEAELRECKMGFRAPGLLNAARQIGE